MSSGVGLSEGSEWEKRCKLDWRQQREQARGQLVRKYDHSEARNYDTMVGTLAEADECAYLADVLEAVALVAGQSVLDVGAGTGALAKVLSRVEGLDITALEPSPAMCELLRRKPELSRVPVVESGCDRDEDRDILAAASFDAIVSRQVVNSLFDPLTAFRNWAHWLKPGGHVVVIEGVYGRDGWTGIWAEEVDQIPLSACQSLATIPYLLESIGLRVEYVDWMSRTNRLPATRTKRYLVVARKP